LAIPSLLLHIGTTLQYSDGGRRHRRPVQIKVR
jgi:hypothetical protein